MTIYWVLKQYWLESGCVYGYRKVYKDLRATGELYGKNRVYRLMRTEELQVQRGYKRKNNYGGGELSPVHLTYLIESLTLKSQISFG